MMDDFKKVLARIGYADSPNYLTISSGARHGIVEPSGILDLHGRYTVHEISAILCWVSEPFIFEKEEHDA